GFMLEYALHIVTGALVGSSCAILSYIMCHAMNRSFISVIAGGFGSEGVIADDSDMADYKELQPAEVADMLKNARSAIITPGYGMAVAHPQMSLLPLQSSCPLKESMSVLAFTPLRADYRDT